MSEQQKRLTPFDGGNDILAPLVREFFRLQLKFDIWIGARRKTAAPPEQIDEHHARSGPDRDPEGFAVWSQSDRVQVENLVFSQKLGIDPTQRDGIQNKVHVACHHAYEFAVSHDEVLSADDLREANAIVEELRDLSLHLETLRMSYAGIAKPINLQPKVDTPANLPHGLDAIHGVYRWHGLECRVTPQEATIIRLLAGRDSASVDEVMQALWNHRYRAGKRHALNVALSRLSSKFAEKNICVTYSMGSGTEDHVVKNEIPPAN